MKLAAAKRRRERESIKDMDQQYDLSQGAKRSANVIVPMVITAYQPRSVIDVGCGVGTWLSVFAAYGVERILGIDGDYIDRSQLAIPERCFLARDLASQLLWFAERFDLAVCLEVVEHLPGERADGFIEDLTDLSDRVLFSAAVPGQGGTNHVNEQPLSYWQERFARHGYRMVDELRPVIAGDSRVDWWYRQNIVVFERSDAPKQEAF